MKYLMEDIATFQIGQVLTRTQEEKDSDLKAYHIYLGEHFLKDSNVLMVSEPIEEKFFRTRQTVLTANEGDLLISLTTNKAAIVNQKHDGYLLTSNYVIVDYDISKLDPDYFCYVYNESLEIKKQIASNIQGSTLVTRLSLIQMRKFTITCPLLDEQVMIGDIYRLRQQKELLQKEKIRLEKLAIYARLKNYLKGEFKNEYK